MKGYFNSIITVNKFTSSHIPTHYVQTYKKFSCLQNATEYIVSGEAETGNKERFRSLHGRIRGVDGGLGRILLQPGGGRRDAARTVAASAGTRRETRGMRGGARDHEMRGGARDQRMSSRGCARAKSAWGGGGVRAESEWGVRAAREKPGAA